MPSFLNPILAYLDSRPGFIDLAVYTGSLLSLIVILAVIYITLLRGFQLIESARRDRIRARWKPVFSRLRAGEAVTSLPLTVAEYPYIMEMWDEECAVAGRELRERLVQLGLQIGLDEAIWHVLRPNRMHLYRRKVWLQSLAIKLACHINTELTREALRLKVDSSDYFLAARACTILLTINAPGCERDVIQILFRFPDHTPFITTQLGEAGGARVLLLLEPFLDLLPAYAEQNFVSLLERSDDPDLLPLLKTRLTTTDSTEEQAAIIRALGRIGDRSASSQIIPFLNSDISYLRVQACNALGSLGTVAERVLLIPLLADRDWWVRYRAAMAYVSLSPESRMQLQSLVNDLPDRYSRDIMNHALVERDWCLT